jgi:hypothetical protein
MKLFRKLWCLFGYHMPVGSIFFTSASEPLVAINCADCNRDVSDDYPDIAHKLIEISESIKAETEAMIRNG